MALLETNKRPGVRYALTREGVELPVVDVTHPAFALSLGAAQQREIMEGFLRQNRPMDRLPQPLRNLLMRVLLRGSVLGGGIQRSRRTFMSGMDTYLLKLGPEMLGSAYSKPIDQRIAAAVPALGVRLRLQDVARLLTDALAPVLAQNAGRSLALVNIAGGPAIDSLNALILLRQEHRDALGKREVSISVLDLDDAGPDFGRAALAALMEAGAPLEGLQATFRHVRYNWADTAVLSAELRAIEGEGALAACSSEGGLFEYGSDAEIVANLEALRAGGMVAVAGSVTRGDEVTRKMYASTRAAVRPRGMEAFGALVSGTGWRVERTIERFFSDQVLLTAQ